LVKCRHSLQLLRSSRQPKLAQDLTPRQILSGNPAAHLRLCRQQPLGAHHGTRFIPFDWDWAAFARGRCGPLCPCFPHATCGGISVSDQVRRTTVAPWSFRKPARKPVRRSGTRALRFVASACIPTGKLQRKRRHVSARTSCDIILQDEDRCSTAPHHRQAKYDSQNPFNIASGKTFVNQTETKFRSAVAVTW